MANVNLKTDFKDGEFLYGDQLKNNFEAIQAALDAMNSIVWQDNADKVVTFRGTTEELMNREIIDGQILYDTTTGESYIDYEGNRISTGSGNAIHIGETEPTNPSTQIWINDNELAAVGSEVVNSLEGDEERMAPSVAAVNEGLAKIIESGNNENGSYIKYSDGTMICTMQKTLTVTTLNRPWGSFYVTPTIAGYDFAQSFIDVPTVTVSVNSNGNAWYLSGGTGATNERTEAFYLASGVTSTSFQCILNYIAIGKWK